jgi:hypothetical protein
MPVMVQEASDETLQMLNMRRKRFDSWDTHRSLTQYWMMPAYFHWQAKKSSKSLAKPSSSTSNTKASLLPNQINLTCMGSG